MKKLLIGVAILLLLLVVAALAAPSFIDWNRYRGAIAERIEAATGRKVTIGGNLSFAVLPTPALSVEDVSLANLPGASRPQMISLKSMQVRISLLPLLGGRLQVDRVRLVEPTIALEVLPDGRRNWDFTGTAAAGGSQSGGAGSATRGSGADVSLESVEISNGHLIYRDVSSGRSEQIEKVDASLRARSLSGPFTATGSLMTHGQAIKFDLNTGRFEGAAPVALDSQVVLPAGKTKLRFSGQVSDIAAMPKVSGRLRAETEDASALAETLGGLGLAAIAPRAGSLEARVAASAAEVAVDDLVLRLGDTSASGAVNLALGDHPSLDATLEINLLDLDGLLTKTGAAKSGPATSAPAVPTAGTTAVGATTPPGLRLPDNLKGAVNINVAAIAWHGSVIRQAQFAGQFGSGSFAISKASALLPGGAELALTGRAATPDGKPRFDGTIGIGADNLRALLSWLQVDVGAVSFDRLLKLRANALVALTPGLLQIGNLDATLDSSHLVGAVNIALRARPSFGAKLDLDRVNLDAYLPQPAGGAGAPSSGAASGSKPTADAKPAAGTPWSAPLAEFDGIVDLHVAELTWNQVPVHDVSLDAKLVAGQLALNRLHVTDAAGADVSASGTARDLGTGASFDFKTSLQAGSLAGLGRLANISLPPAVAQARGVKFQANVSGAPGVLELRGLQLALGPADVAGDIALRYDGPRPKLTAKLSGNDLVLDQLLPVAAPLTGTTGRAAPAAAAPAGAAAADEHWSDDPLPFAMLSSFDADLAVTAHRLAYKAYSLGEPRVDVALENGVLSIQQLQGRLFDGQLDVKGRLVGTGTPSADLHVELAEGNLQQALAALAGLDKVSGRFNLQGDFQSQGQSQRQLVRQLAGAAKLTAHDGSVRGIDVKALSDRLKQLNGPTDFLDLLTRSLSGGQTKLISADGNWKVEHGVARTDDTKALLEASTASLAGTVNLPAWTMDLKTSLRLNEHPDAPAIGIGLSGPLDQPQRDLKTRDLEQYLVQKLGSKLLKDKVGDKLQQILGGPAAPAGGAQNPPEAKSPEKELKDLLRNLGR